MHHKFEHVYIEHKGVKYYDYTLYIDPAAKYSLSPKDTELIISGTVRRKLEEMGSFRTIDSVVPKGSKIYMFPNCPYAANDIRRNYEIKRGLDNGEYNVLCPIPEYYRSLYFRSMLIFPKKRIVLATYDTTTEAYLQLLATNLLPGIDYQDKMSAVYTQGEGQLFAYRNIAPGYKDLLDGKVMKPCVLYNQLDLNGANDLTIDVLQLVLSTGKQKDSKDAMENHKVQLNVLNQHNWRDYPGTVSMLMGELLERGCVSHCMYSRSSQFSKPVKEILRCRYENFKDENDLKLAQSFINSLLNIGDGRFTTIANVYEKCKDINLSINTFNKLFNNIVKLTPRNFDNVCKS